MIPDLTDLGPICCSHFWGFESLIDSVKTSWKSTFFGMWEVLAIPCPHQHHAQKVGKTVPFKPNRDMFSCQGTGRNVWHKTCHGMDFFSLKLQNRPKHVWTLMFCYFLILVMMTWLLFWRFHVLPQAADVVPGLLLGTPGISRDRCRALRWGLRCARGSGCKVGGKWGWNDLFRVVPDE